MQVTREPIYTHNMHTPTYIYSCRPQWSMPLKLQLPLKHKGNKGNACSNAKNE